MTHQLSLAPRRGSRKRFTSPVIAVVTVAMLAAVMTFATLAGPAPAAHAQLEGTTCYTINDDDGSMSSWTGGVETVLGETGFTNIESLAANQDRNELWAYDDTLGELLVFTPGNPIPIQSIPYADGDLDALTWVNHTDNDPTNDQLWGTYRNGVNVNLALVPPVGVNVADELVQVDFVAGAEISATPITDPGAGSFSEEDDNDGLAWDPTTGLIYGVIGGDTTPNVLTVLTPGTNPVTITPTVPLTLNGLPLYDLESLGIGADGQLYGSTGEDPAPAGSGGADPSINRFYSIDKTTGVATEIGDQTGLDWEATACLSFASLGDYVWEDINNDGLQDGTDVPIAGVVVNLLDAAGNPTGLTTTTDANGFYEFTDLPPGTYIVEFIPPAGRTFVTTDVGANDALDSDADQTTGQTAPTELFAGDNDPTLDAGIAPILNSLGDYVWDCLLYTSPSPRDATLSRMPSSA